MQFPPGPWQALIVTAFAAWIAVLAIPQCVVGVPFHVWLAVRCSVAVEVVSYIVRCEWFSAWVCCTRTVNLPGAVLPKPSCIAPDVIAAAWCTMCDGQATQVVLVNGVALICTIVEAYWIGKRVPHCSATDVVVLHPMHWKDDRVTTYTDCRSTDLDAVGPVLCQWWWAGGTGLTHVDVGHSHEPPHVDVGHSHEPPLSAALLLQLTEELVSSLPRRGTIVNPVHPRLSLWVAGEYVVAGVSGVFFDEPQVDDY